MQIKTALQILRPAHIKIYVNLNFHISHADGKKDLIL